MSAPRVCPECGEEYLATVLVCADCDVSLVADAPARVATRELPPVEQLVCVREASLAIAQGLSDRLADEGITHRIQVQPSPEQDPSQPRRPGTMPYGVYVLEADAQAAAVVDRAYMRSQLPDLDAEAETGNEGCPACGAPVAPDAAECPDCGLVLLSS